MLSNEIKSEISAKINQLREEIARDFAKRSDIPDVSVLASKQEIPDVSGFLNSLEAARTYAKKNELPDISGFLSSSEAQKIYAEKSSLSSFLTSNDVSSLQEKIASNKHYYEGGDFLKIIKTEDYHSYPFELIKTMTISATENKGRTIAVNIFSDWIVTAAMKGGGSFQYQIRKSESGNEYTWREGKMAGKVITYPTVFFDSANTNQDVSYKLYVKPLGTYLYLKGRLELCVM